MAWLRTTARSVVLGGNSMGGGATWRYALAYPALNFCSAPPLAKRQTHRWVRSPTPIAFQLLARLVSHHCPVLRSRALVEQGLRATYTTVRGRPSSSRPLLRTQLQGTAPRSSIAPAATRQQQELDPSILEQPTLMWGAQDSVISVNVAGFLPNVCQCRTDHL